MHSGHCECGRIKFEFDGEINDFSHCHCSQCRRMHGAAYATYAGVARDNFRILGGDPEITKYASSDTHNRWFCSVCGSNILVDLSEDRDSLYLSMSAINGDPPRPTGYHIFVGSKAVWHEITDDLEQYDTEPAD